MVISPWIYGTNQPWGDSPSRYTLVRQGGNRMTAYNWENNASNAGSDWQHQSDGFLSESNVPGEFVRAAAAKVLGDGQTFLATVPIVDYVAADKNGGGDVKNTGPDYLAKRFRRNLPARPDRQSTTVAKQPNVDDDVVVQAEFVVWLDRTFPKTARRKGANLWFSLDNEPDLWSHTHARIYPAPITYAELSDRSTRFAKAIKSAAPEALTFGFVSYGWGGFTTLQGAPDGKGRDATEAFLAAMKKAEAGAGRRLIDVIDLHWYSEARSGKDEATGVRVSENGPRAHEPAVNEARMQATRSLWDATYRETSWIGRTLREPIRLIPRIRAKIDAHYPGTKFAITEYNYGGGENMSGGIAQADALGIFGREGLFAAALWSLGDKEPFTRAAFDAYRNYDSRGQTFGETALRVDNPSTATLGVYASRRQGDGAIIVVITNQSDSDRPVSIDVRGSTVKRAGSWQMTIAQPAMVVGQAAKVEGNRVVMTVPALSVNTLELR